MKIDKLTLIEEYKGILLKRDDLFKLRNVNGGKLRQAIHLIDKNYEEILNKHNNSVVCSCSIKSPQSGIIASVCREYNINCNIVVFGTKALNNNLIIAKQEGAKIYSCPSGYNSVIEHYAKKYFPNDFFINMGFASKEVLDVNTFQVENIPDDLDYLVVPIGSAINFVSILKGLIKFNKKPKEVIGVYVGKDPTNFINSFNFKIDYLLVKYNKPYSFWLYIEEGFFDPIYEAKAYEWLLRNLDIKNKKVLFWVIGKRCMDIKPERIEYFKIEDKNMKLVEV